MESSQASSVAFGVPIASVEVQHSVASSLARGVDVGALVNVVRCCVVHRRDVVIAHRVRSRRSELDRPRRGPLVASRRVATHPTVSGSTSAASFVLPRISISTLSSSLMQTHHHPSALPPNHRIKVVRSAHSTAQTLRSCAALYARRWASEANPRLHSVSAAPVNR